MGCFNMTCSVSHLPITAGMPIRAFWVAQPYEAQEYTSSPSCFFVPISTGVSGRFDDYGRIEDCKPSKAFDIACAHYFPNLEDPRTIFDGNIKLPLQFNHYREVVKCTGSLAFVREDVFQSVQIRGESPWNPLPTVQRISKDLVVIKEALVEEQEKYGSSLKGHASLRMTIMDERKDLGILSRLFKSSEGELLVDTLTPYADALVTMLHQHDKVTDPTKLNPELIKFAFEVAELIQFDGALGQLGIAWQPATKMIGQARPYQEIASFYEDMLAICKQEIKAQKKEDRKLNPPLRQKKAQKIRKTALDH